MPLRSAATSMVTNHAAGATSPRPRSGALRERCRTPLSASALELDGPDELRAGVIVGRLRAIQSEAIVIGPGVRIPTAPGLAMPTMSIGDVLLVTLTRQDDHVVADKIEPGIAF